LNLYGPYYTDQAFEGDMQMMTPFCRGAVRLYGLLEKEENGDVLGIKDLLEPTVRDLPELKEEIFRYAREMAREAKTAETDRQDEMAYLAAVLKKKAAELEKAGEISAANEIREQLKSLGML
jgi:hypothetical protein